VRIRKNFVLPEELQEAEKKARRLEYWTVFFLLTITALMYYTMGSSQAMKTAWIEDVLSLIPPVVFLIATHQRRKAPDERFPYGRQRIMSIAFTAAAFALTILGLYMLYDSARGLLTMHHPTLGHRTILGVRVWSGWFMIAALLYSAIPPVVLGRMKLPLAERLHEKTLKADADMNKADWMTAGAAILGILGIGIGLWWADSVAALLISLDVLKDGFGNVKAVFSDLMDQRPTTVDREPMPGPGDAAIAALRRLEWVEDADIRLHEEGAVLAGDAFVVPRGGSATVGQLQEASRVVHQADWKLYDVVVTAVESVDRHRDPQGEPIER
jgi:divalent metal cation (Fe/Co/Zn/Cd) transporter